MQTITTTRWIDEKNSDLAFVETQLLAYHPDETGGSSTCYINWNIQKAFDKEKQIILNGKMIEYNFYSYSVDQISSSMQAHEDIEIKKTGFIIPYISGGRLRYIISRNSGAQAILRKMLFYSGKGEIVKNELPLTGDFFVWLIHKVYSGNNTIESESDSLADLTIDYVRGFKGNTEDMLTRVSAVGESVMNIISTLSFLLESQNLNQITLDIAYREHNNIEVTLSNRNTVATTEGRYLGALLSEGCSDPERISIILLTLYVEVLPILMQGYQSEIDLNLWGQGKCVDFLKQVANDLSNKVTKRVEDLEKYPEQLKMSFDDNVLLNQVDCTTESKE